MTGISSDRLLQKNRQNRFFVKFPYLVIYLVCCSLSVLGKVATVHVITGKFAGKVEIYNPQPSYDLKKNNLSQIYIDSQHQGKYSVELKKPSYFILSFFTKKKFKCCLFLSPGDEISLTADFTKTTPSILVTGKGSNNNQPEIFSLTEMDTQPFFGDKEPDRIIAAINKQSVLNKTLLTRYVRTYQPSEAFIKNALLNLEYFAPLTFYEFNHNTNFNRPENELHKWKKVQDSIFSKIKLNNNNALNSCNYIRLINNFMLRETEDLWEKFRANPKSFYKKWSYSGKRFINRNSEPENSVLGESIIQKYFTGNVSEYAYSQLLTIGINEMDFESIPSAFNHFVNKHPQSKYIQEFAEEVRKMVSKQKNVINDKMHFWLDNGSKLNTFKDVLKLIKGKTVFLDMWGTWCSPCRKEIADYSETLRESFKNKGVVFLYIANFDLEKTKEWKKQILYFNIQGEHILANSKLTNDIMRSVKATGYPTYIIIKKDGSYHETTSKCPLNINNMIKEIEAARVQ